MANVVEEITIKKEIEDYPDSPSHNEAPDSSSTPPENSSNQKYSKDTSPTKAQKNDQNAIGYKVTLWLKPTGNAPIIRTKKWTVDKDTTLANIMKFMKQKLLMIDESDPIFLYVNQAFAPSPDHEVGNIYDCFNINGKLVLHYSISPAWG